MTEKAVPQSSDDLDLARFAFGAYVGLDEDKPALIEVMVWTDGIAEDYSGMVNPCKFGDQCEGHACYCNHPGAYRKCRRSWYTGGEEPDEDCEYYEPNPYWLPDTEGDFYDKRYATVKKMYEEGLASVEQNPIDAKRPDWYKRRSEYYPPITTLAQSSKA